MQAEYGPIELKYLGDALAGEDSSRDWLFKNDFKELAALCDVMIDKNQSAGKWLTKNGFGSLVLFYNAINGHHGALKALVRKDEKIWAAVVYAFNLDSNAIDWLTASGYEHYAKFSDRLYVIWRKKKSLRRGYKLNTDRIDWL
jgi:hypothetical protein